MGNRKICFHRYTLNKREVTAIRLQDYQLEKLLSLQPDPGKNYLKNMRVLILNVEAIGVLRKDLVCTLGTEQAKGFLIRYGYACGFRDAVSTMRDFPLDDKAETYRLGALLHTWVGMANVTPVDIRCDEADRSWYFEGIWHNSYEAENHVKHFGPASEPVCWTLVGYAGGFRSAYFGERVIYKEVSCSARGDPYCRFIGKTLADWGDEIVPDLNYYQETNLGEALEKAHVRIQAQNELLRHSTAIHEQLTRMVLNGEEISAIAGSLGRIVGGAVIVEDQFFRPVAYFSPSTPGEKDWPASPPFSTGEIFSDWRYRRFAELLTSEKRPVLIPPEQAKKPFSRLIAPIIIGQEVLGYVCMFKARGDFTELDQMTLERAATVFALKMMQTRAVAEVETRLKGDFVNDLISGSFDSEASIMERAGYLGYDLDRLHQILLIHVDNFPHLTEKVGRDERRIHQFKGQVCEAVNRALKAGNRCGVVTVRSDHIITLSALKANEKAADTVNLARNIKERISQQFPQISVSVGIGRVCRTPRDYSLSYQEAQRALEVIKSLNQSNTVLSFDHLGIYGLLFNASNRQDLLDFMQEQLGRLQEYDARYQGQLLETLDYFFAHDGNIKEAAQTAAVSVSGYKYRLKKICEVGGINLKDSRKKFDLQLAIKIWQITKATSR